MTVSDPQVLLDVHFLLILSGLIQSYLKPFSRVVQEKEETGNLLSKDQDEDIRDESLAHGVSDGEVIFVAKVTNPRIALLEDPDVADAGALVLQVGVSSHMTYSVIIIIVLH